MGLKDNSPDTEASNLDKQQAMAFLRERYLYLLSNLCRGTDCEIKMYENTSVRGRIKAFEPRFENIIVENLETPLPTPVNKAILRTNDIISIQLDYDPSNLLK